MKKTKITSRKFKGELIIGIGYCEVQNLLRYTEAVYYGSNIYGWNIDGIIIYTGHKPISDVVINNIDKSVEHFEEQARWINTYSTMSTEEKAKHVNSILYEFIEYLKYIIDGGEPVWD